MPVEPLASPHDLADVDPATVTWWRPTWRNLLGQLLRKWDFVGPAAVLVLFATGLLVLLGLFGTGLLVPLVEVAMAALCLLSVVFPLAVLMIYGSAGHALRQVVHARREPFCIHCGYSLAGLPDRHRCPECGRPYTWAAIEEYRRDPDWFIARWKLHHRAPAAAQPFHAGNGPSPGDGTR